MLGELRKEIIHSLSQPYSIEGQRVVIGASVGIAMAPEDGDTSRRADPQCRPCALCRQGWRARPVPLLCRRPPRRGRERAQLEQDLRDAITPRASLSCIYQPVVATATEKITGFEALLRWHHPKGWMSAGRSCRRPRTRA
jgi:predicted signal transduction protein with EAL and GGDEF domain